VWAAALDAVTFWRLGAWRTLVLAARHLASSHEASVSGRGPGAPAQMVTFEAFRDLVKLLQLGVGDEAGIALAEEENVEARAAAQSAAAAEAASGAPVGPPMPFSAPSGAGSKDRQKTEISSPSAACRLALQHRGRPVRPPVSRAEWLRLARARARLLVQ